MNVARVHLRNFRSYAALDLELPEGATALIGPNGAGKSSILAAIDVALFGATSLEPFLRHGERKLEVTVEVEHGGSRYRVRRGLSGTRSSLDFEQVNEDGPGWKALTLETQKATQGLIEATLGLTRETFRASAYLMQGDAGAITNARPAERMAILRDVIGGLEVYDAAHEHAKRLLATARTDLAELTGRVALLVEAASDLPEMREQEASIAADVADLEHSIVEAARERVELTEVIRQAREQLADFETRESLARAARERLEALEAAVTAAEARAEELDTLREQLRALEADAAPEAERESLVQSLERHAQVSQERAELFGRVQAIEHEGLLLERQAKRDESLGPGETRCGECGQLLGEEALHTSIATRRARADGLLAKRDELLEQANALELPELPERVPDLADARAELEDARLARQRAVEVKTRIGVLEMLRPVEPEPDVLEAAREEARATREAFEEASETKNLGVSGPERRLTKLNVTVSQLEQQLTALRRSHAHAEQRRRTLEEQAARAKALEAQRDKGAREVRVLELTVAMFSPTGIPLLVIDNAIPVIELRAQEVLERLGGETASCLLELRTQRANKGDGQLRDTLDILIHAPSGEALPYEHWSGGEKMRLDLALRVGLAQLLLAQGANVELFAVDEPDGLDAQGRAALAEVVEEMGDRYGFRKVLLISHDETLRDSFAQTLEVARPDGGPSEVAA